MFLKSRIFFLQNYTLFILSEIVFYSLFHIFPPLIQELGVYIKVCDRIFTDGIRDLGNELQGLLQALIK